MICTFIINTLLLMYVLENTQAIYGAYCTYHLKVGVPTYCDTQHTL